MPTHLEHVQKGNRSSGLEWSIGDDEYAVRDKPAAHAATPPTETAPAQAPTKSPEPAKAAEVMSHYADSPAPAHHSHGHGEDKKHDDGNHKGATKPGIRAVQQVLRDMGLYEKDGKHHSDVDGKIGPRTIAALHRADAVVRHELLQMLSPDELVAFNGAPAHAGGHEESKA